MEIKIHVKMVRCLGEEPEPPTSPEEVEAWCQSGRSASPIQTHVGDERLLWSEEIEYVGTLK